MYTGGRWRRRFIPGVGEEGGICRGREEKAKGYTGVGGEGCISLGGEGAKGYAYFNSKQNLSLIHI